MEKKQIADRWIAEGCVLSFVDPSVQPHFGVNLGGYYRVPVAKLGQFVEIAGEKFSYVENMVVFQPIKPAPIGEIVCYWPHHVGIPDDKIHLENEAYISLRNLLA